GNAAHMIESPITQTKTYRKQLMNLHRLLIRRYAVLGLTSAILQAAILFPESLCAQAKTESEMTPTLLKVIPEGVYAKQNDYAYPFYEITLVGEKFPSGDDLKIFVDDREVHAIALKPEDEGPPSE